MDKSPDVVLLYPPHASITHPYLSLPTLSAYLRRAGFEVLQRDAGIEAFDLMMEPEYIDVCLQKIRDTLGQPQFPRIQRKKRAILELAQASGDFVLGNLVEAKDFFRRSKGFFDVDVYIKNHNVLKRAMGIVSAAYYPLEMKFNELNFKRVTSLTNIYKFTKDESILTWN